MATTRLVGVFLLLSLAACGGGSGGPTTPGGAPATPATGTTLEQQIYARINDHRTMQGLATLAWHDVIADQARQHSRNMATGAVVFGHDGFNTRTSVIAQTLPFASAAENIAMTSRLSDQAAAIVSGWVSDAAHRANIEGGFDLTGVGVASASTGAVYVTQIFIRSR